MSDSAASPDFRIVAIGASAGGVEALTALFNALPRELEAAILVVLHIPPDGQTHLASILAAETGMRVAPATDGERLEAGCVYVAQSDRHLMVGEGVVRLTRGPRECRVRPAIDVLFRSVALHYGPRAVGVVLSGTLDDGSAGLWSIKDRQGIALVQAPSDARFSSMPESAIRHVAVDFVGTVPALAAEIVRLTQQPHPPGRGSPHGDRLVLESLIAGEGNALKNGVLELGQLSRYSCPECHGVLVQIEEGSILRFRCHTGHAYTVQSLLAEINHAIDASLWATVRALEERLLLLRQICGVARAHGEPPDVEQCDAQAEHAETRVAVVRELVLDPHLFGTASAR